MHFQNPRNQEQSNYDRIHLLFSSVTDVFCLLVEQMIRQTEIHA